MGSVSRIGHAPLKSEVDLYITSVDGSISSSRLGVCTSGKYSTWERWQGGLRDCRKGNQWSGCKIRCMVFMGDRIGMVRDSLG